MPDFSLISQAFTRHAATFAVTQEELEAPIMVGAGLVREALVSGHTLFACGNGGSAADAQHFAAEWVCKYKEDRTPFPAIALSANTSTVTAIGNDFGFDEIFSRQVRALGRAGDVLVAFTTSGASKNVLNALAAAKEKKMKTIVFTGARGKHLEGQYDVVLAVPSAETARVQELHLLIYHAWCEWFDAMMSPASTGSEKNI